MLLVLHNCDNSCLVSFKNHEKCWNSSLKVTELWEISLKGTELWEITLDFCVQYIGQRKIITRASTTTPPHTKNTGLYPVGRFSLSLPSQTTKNKTVRENVLCLQVDFCLFDFFCFFFKFIWLLVVVFLYCFRLLLNRLPNCPINFCFDWSFSFNPFN